MPDSSANALQELVKAADIDESGCRVSERRAKKNVVGLVRAGAAPLGFVANEYALAIWAGRSSEPRYAAHAAARDG